MCIDYWDLNRASPKDNFPLPHIDILVDNTTNFALFSFMDGFSGYNQIKMAPEDMEKTTFVTLWGTFCYNVMSFGLKNVGATYQWGYGGFVPRYDAPRNRGLCGRHNCQV